MNKIKQFVMALTLVMGIGLFMAPSYVGAVGAIDETCAQKQNQDSVICKNKGDSVQEVIGFVVNTLLFLVGIAAVVVIIIGGITYTTSAGNEQSIVRAKNMILYAIIGLVIAFAAYALVNWVVKAFG